MAKEQSFEAKTKKKKVEQEFKPVKVLFSYKTGENGWRFKERLVKVPFEANEEQFIQEEIDKVLKQKAK
jgi:hypothetical protein